MLSTKLIQLIEDHWELLTRRTLILVRSDSRLTNIQALSESDLQERISQVCKNLGQWLAAGDDERLAEEYEALGRKRYREGIPLDEVVHAFHVVKHRMLDFVRDQGVARTSIDVYAEEELEHRVGLFFDAVIYHIVRGYAQAWQAATAEGPPSSRAAARGQR